MKINLISFKSSKDMKEKISMDRKQRIMKIGRALNDGIDIFSPDPMKLNVRFFGRNTAVGVNFPLLFTQISFCLSELLSERRLEARRDCRDLLDSRSDLGLMSGESMPFITFNVFVS